MCGMRSSSNVNVVPSDWWMWAIPSAASPRPMARTMALSNAIFFTLLLPPHSPSFCLGIHPSFTATFAYR